MLRAIGGKARIVLQQGFIVMIVNHQWGRLVVESLRNLHPLRRTQQDGQDPEEPRGGGSIRKQVQYRRGIEHEQALIRRFDVVINATPLGQWPNVTECPFEEEIPGNIVFDMVYNPMETLLIKRAREQGKKVIPGIKMFIEQAVRQFEVWTGETAPRAAMETAALDALETRYSEQKA